MHDNQLKRSQMNTPVINNEGNQSPIVWKESWSVWGSLFLMLALLIALHFNALRWTVREWTNREEYSYGFLIPFISLFLVWQRKDELERIDLNGSWAGLAVLLVGLIIHFIGELSALFVFIQYSFVVTLAGAVLAFTGRDGFRKVWVPVAFLLFMIPLPNFLYNDLSTRLQLASSAFGVGFIRLLNIPVFLDGNVIDLGTYKLQVAQACSGLRYLFPLMSIAFITSYFFKAALWKRVVVFLSSIPITVLMNSFRIGVIGVLVNSWGISMARGFLHQFEGWVVFMACLAILLAEMWLLTLLGTKRGLMRDSLGLEFPNATPKDAVIKARRVPRPFFACILVIAVAVAFAPSWLNRKEITPQRQDFSTFPMTLKNWHGHPEVLSAIYVEVLRLNDYLLADYANQKGNIVNFYVAYYASQRKGQTIHSPRACIPGGGWDIDRFSQISISDARKNGESMTVNRAVISKAGDRQLVYYWFRQNSRILTNEYVMRWYLFWDALTKDRTDGALVRLTTEIGPGETTKDADRRLTGFLRIANPELRPYVPE